MSTVIGSAATRETRRECSAPALDALEDNVRKARRAIVEGRHAAEDAIDAMALLVRRHPLGAASVAAATGAMVGCVVGFAFGWRAPRRP